MVPQVGVDGFVGHGFPRASGDGPACHPRQAHQPAFPPRERGWSLEQVVRLGPRHVSPARAGMVPGSKLDVVVRCGFPRASGDGPSRYTCSSTLTPFPPRERGWSVGERMNPQVSGVSPARAGMVPFKCQKQTPVFSFPRASGDGPNTEGRALRTAAFPPRERGWSLCGPIRGSCGVVSPARAGMVPRAS